MGEPPSCHLKPEQNGDWPPEQAAVLPSCPQLQLWFFPGPCCHLPQQIRAPSPSYRVSRFLKIGQSSSLRVCVCARACAHILLVLFLLTVHQPKDKRSLGAVEMSQHFVLFSVICLLFYYMAFKCSFQLGITDRLEQQPTSQS